MKKSYIAILLLLTSCVCVAQTYTNVTATLTDGGGQVWANAHITATIQAPFGNPNKLNNLGHDIISPIDFFADGTGTFTGVSFDDNTVILPTGSTWKFSICPNATVAHCSESIQVVHGASMNLSASLSADLVIPTVAAAPTIYRAYIDSEVTGGQGAIYWRVTDNTLRGFNGSTWVPVGSGGGGPSPSLWSSLLSPTANLILNMNNFTTQFNMGTTGSTGGAFNITDSTSNTGTNYLFQVSTGTSSTAKPWSVCAKGTNDCVEFNASAVMQVLGAAQLIATQVLNTGPGVGVIQLGSNGSGSISQANTIKLTGNTNKAYLSENAAALAKVLLGGQVTCTTGNKLLQSVDIDGNNTCIDVFNGNNVYTGVNVMGTVRGILIQEETGSNSDIYGSLAFSGGTTSATYTFATGTTHTCTYAPTFNPTTTSIWINNEGSTLQFTSSANLTGSVNYWCGGYATF